MSDPSPPGTAERAAWPPSRFAKLGCLLPIGAIVIFIVVLMAWPRDRHHETTDFEAWIFFGSLALIPITTVLGVILSIVAIVRGRRSSAAGQAGTPALAAIGIAVAIACLVVGVALVWALLVGASRFR